MYLLAEDEGALPADDFLEALSSDLEIPMLLNGGGSPDLDESPDEIMKNALEDMNFGISRTADSSEFSDYFASQYSSSSRGLLSLLLSLRLCLSGIFGSKWS